MSGCVVFFEGVECCEIKTSVAPLFFKTDEEAVGSRAWPVDWRFAVRCKRAA